MANQTSLFYQELVGCMGEILSKIKNIHVYDPKQIVPIVWKNIIEVIPDLSNCLIIELKEDNLKNLAEGNFEHYVKPWWQVDYNSQQALLSKLVPDENDDTFCWNYSSNAPQFTNIHSNKLAIAISRLCDLPNDSRLFLFFFRDKPKKPFISHEIKSMQLISMIVGSHINFTFNYQTLLESIRKRY